LAGRSYRMPDREVAAQRERTLKLKYLVLSGIPPSQFVYLVEAANCYIYGLPQAAVALARAAMEESLRDKLALSVGKKAAKALDLEDIIKDLGRTKDLSRDGVTRAHNVRISGNKVLHPDPEVPQPQVAGAPDGLAAIEDARAVILEVSRRIDYR